MRAGTGVGVISVFALAVAVWIALLLPETPPPPLRELEGTYSNPCCGSFTIQHGRLYARALSSPAETGMDKQGIYVMPDKYFGVESGNRIGFDNGFPLKLRVNRKARPIKITVWDMGGSTTYDFVRTVTPTRGH
jgi:hypothetical protein